MSHPGQVRRQRVAKKTFSGQSQFRARNPRRNLSSRQARSLASVQTRGLKPSQNSQYLSNSSGRAPFQLRRVEDSSDFFSCVDDRRGNREFCFSGGAIASGSARSARLKLGMSANWPSKSTRGAMLLGPNELSEAKPGRPNLTGRHSPSRKRGLPFEQSEAARFGLSDLHRRRSPEPRSRQTEAQ